MRSAEKLNISWSTYCELSAYIATNNLEITVEKYLNQKNNPSVSLLDIIKGWFTPKEDSQNVG